MVAASGPTSAEAAGRFGDGFISVAPKAEIVQKFQEAGDEEKPRYGQVTVCWAESEDEARDVVSRIWPNNGLTGQMSQELRTVVHMEQAVKMLSEEQRSENIVCGPDPQAHLDRIQAFIDAGYDHIYIHQIGPDQEGFFRFYKQEILPELS
jgi:G6PDH family F420-dependent oxidoreductase